MATKTTPAGVDNIAAAEGACLRANPRIDTPESDVYVAPFVTATVGFPRASSFVLRFRSYFRFSFSSRSSTTRSACISHPWEKPGRVMKPCGFRALSEGG